MTLLLTFIFAFLFSFPAFAENPSFDLPVDCTLNTDCWIVNYVDTDPEKDSAKDFQCGPRTYDEHHGTDFGITDLAAMETGVDVIAAADGKVLRVRDEMDDKIVTQQERLKLLEGNKGCGNGVYIDHGDGWQSIYCHLKKDSLTVKPGQDIRQGDKIGLVGASGIAEFPHLHFGIFFEGHTIDPFTGFQETGACNQPGEPLWRPALGLKYEPVLIYAAGFKDGVPDFEAIKIDARTPQKLPANSDALTFWVGMYGVAKDDMINIEILDPLGRIFAEREIIHDKNRARQFYFVGRRVHEKGLEKGTYTANVHITRKTSTSEAIEERTSRTLIVE